MSSVDASTLPTRQSLSLPEHALAIDYDNPLHQKWSPTFRRLVLPPDPETRATRLFTWTLALGVASLYLFALLCFWAPAHPGVDQNGYFVGGRQFAETLSTGITTRNDFEFIGRMYIRVESGENFPKYPLGLPILFAICIWLQPLWNLVHWDGHDVAHLISPVSAALATLGVFAFVRRLAGGFAGLLAMLLLGFSQVMLTLSINPNSHALGTCLTVWSFFLMVRWLETGALWRGMLCAFLLGYAYLVRYTEGLQAIPLGVAMLYAAIWWRPGLVRSMSTLGGALLFAVLAYAIARTFGADIAAGKSWVKPLTENGGMPFKLVVGSIVAAALASVFIHPRSLWRLLMVGFAWLVPVLYQTLFNMIEMGSFTSYAGTNESTGFDPDYFMANWEKMIRVLNDQGLFFVAPIGFIGLIAMFRKLPMVATILTLWFVPSILLYTAYYWAPDQWGVAYSRFVLTELPAIVIPAAWLLSRLVSDGSVAHSPRRATFLLPLAGAVVLAVGLAVAIVVSRNYSPSKDPFWWATAVPAIVLSLVGVALLGCVTEISHGRVLRQLANPVPRIAVGAAAFVACAIASYRCVNGTEWGQRINARANLEAQSFENKNLATLGKAARAVIPPDAVVFADGDRLHHLQWLSRWEMFPADGFNPEIVRRLLWRSTPDETEPDPIDPGRLKFLRGVYEGKDQAALVLEQNRIMSEAIRNGRRVFLVLSESTGQAFLRKFVTPSAKKKDGMIFESKVCDTIVETLMPRMPDDFLEPNERPKLPVGRGGRALSVAAFAKQAATNWQIVEVLAKAPEAPSTQPASVATTP